MGADAVGVELVEFAVELVLDCDPEPRLIGVSGSEEREETEPALEGVLGLDLGDVHSINEGTGAAVGLVRSARGEVGTLGFPASLPAALEEALLAGELGLRIDPIPARL